MKGFDTIYNQHAENKEWMSKLKFYHDDLHIMQKRLDDMASRNSHKECMAAVEHFQNQFTLQKENVDNLIHDIQINEYKLEDEIQRNPSGSEKRQVGAHFKEKENIHSVDKLMKELRMDFNRFATKWM